MRPGRGLQDRTVIITLLDAFAIIAGCAAVVLAFGAHTRVVVANTVLVSVKNPTRPLMAALALAVLRFVLSRRMPVLPALRRSAFPLQDDRDWFAKAQPLPAGFWGWASALIALCLVALWPQIVNMRAVPDPGDPFFSAWRLAWFAHQVVTSPAHLFDANILYPRPLTLTYSDAILLQAIVAAPFIWLGADPLLVSNALLVAAFLLTGVAFLFAAWRLTGSLPAGVVAGLMGALYPFHFEHYSHLELQFFMWVPLAVVALLRFLAEPRRSTALVFATLIAAQWLSSLYFGVMLLTFLVPFGALIAIAWRIRLSAALARHAALAAVVMLVPIVAITAPYLASRDARGDRSPDVILEYSATPQDYFGLHHSSGYAGRFDRTYTPERELFPGVTPVLFGLAGLVPPLRVTTIATAVSAALALDWSFGLRGLSYPSLHRWLAPYRGMRVPARFSVFVGSALVLLAAFSLARLFRRLRGPWPWLVLGVLCACVLMDLRPRLKLSEHWRETPGIYASVTSDMVLAEFPAGAEIDIAYMYFSTTHWARMLNGYSGYLPDPEITMRQALETFPAPGSLSRLKQEGATHVTINCALLAQPERCRSILAALDESHEVVPVAAGVWEENEVRLYALR